MANKKKYKTPEEFEALYQMYLRNMTEGLVRDLIETLDNSVTAKNINSLGVGYDIFKGAWVFAERDELGHVIGLSLRYRNGSKFMIEGSRRGLTYACRQRIDRTGTHVNSEFVPCRTVGVDCPMCGKKGWCMVSNDDPSNPSAVICGRTPANAVKYIENSGYLHKLRNDNHNNSTLWTPLQGSDKPVIVVEGASDTLVGMGMGYVTVGKPSADGGKTLLGNLLRHRKVIVVGENDSGAGLRGMHSTAKHLKVVCEKVKTLQPPNVYKDLRKWAPSSEEFESWLETKGEVVNTDKILFDIDYPAMADLLLTEIFTKSKQGRLIWYEDDWWKYTGHNYAKLPSEVFENIVGDFFYEYEVANGIEEKNPTVKKLSINNRFMLEMTGAMRRKVFTARDPMVDEPFIISSGAGFDASRTIIFRNGMLDVPTRRLIKLSDEIFFRSAVPYNYDPMARCELWLSFLDQVFAGDEECIALLQEWFGYNLIATNFMEQTMFLYGEAGSGKSTIGEVLQAVVGEDRCASPSVSDLTSSTFGQEHLVGKYVLRVDEEGREMSRSQAQRYLQFIKRITGNDSFSVNRKYKSAINTRFFCKITNICNSLPVFLDETQSLYRRFNVLFFPISFQSNPDTTLKMRLVEERKGIAAWAVRGLQRLLKVKKFTLPKSSLNIRTEAMLLSSPIRAMLHDWCMMDEEDAFTTRDELFDLYRGICEADKVKAPVARRLFYRRLAEAWPECREYEGFKRIHAPGVSGELQRGYKGLRIMDEARQKFMAN